MTPDAQTLTQRLAAGRLPLPDALRYALQIADALRHAHEEGYCHGALTPDAVLLTHTGVELIPAQPGAVEALTPYTAPERLKGLGPDARTDIYALGAILYEILAGRRAFEAVNEEALADVIENTLPTPIGDTGLDRLVLNCLVKDPAGRWQRVQQVHMEIKILTFSGRRPQPGSLTRSDTAIQTEMRQIESRLTARLDQYDQTLSQVKQNVAPPSNLAAELTPRIAQHDQLLAGLQQITASQNTVLDAVTQTLTSAQDRVQLLETQLAAARERADYAARAADELNEGSRRESAGLQVSLAGELHALELTVKAQGAAIESIRGAMARTDDFMERVVEALESLQTMVLERANDRAIA